MIVLHGAVSGGEFVVWAETPEGQARAKTPARTKAPWLPFDAGAKALVAATAEAVPGLSFAKGAAGDRVIWVPTTAAGPVASSPLVGEPPKGRARAELAPWRVSGLTLDAGQAVDLVAACVGTTTLAAGVIVGSTLTYWSSALRFAGSLVARQQFLPGLVREADGFTARWQPVVTGADAGRRGALARAMPAACRALGRDAKAAPESPAATALGTFLDAAVDRIVRASRPPAPARGKFASVHDAWLHALHTEDAAVSGTPEELESLDRQVAQWRRPIDLTAEAPVRLCFRLEEPDVDDDGADDRPRRAKVGDDVWSLRYLLQAADDPSLLVPLADVWGANGRGPKALPLAKAGVDPKEYLLAALGQAAALYPGVETSLKSPAPVGFTFDAAGAHEFLTRHASALEQAGFGVLLPAWWTRKGTKLRLSTRAKVKSPPMGSKAGLSLDDVLAFEWKVALGENTLTLAELQALARLKTPLVRIRGQWVQLDADEIAAALSFWKAKGDARLTARDAVHMALGAAAPPGGLEFQGVDATGWLSDLLDGLKSGAGPEKLAPPEGFRGALRPYQERGFSWLDFLTRWGFGACLADDMGLGKTVQTLALLLRRWEASRARARRPTLLICPTSVVGNWAREASKFTPGLPVMVHHGVARAKEKAFKTRASKQALVVSSYALLHRDFETLKAVPWAGLILDEAQNVKNPETKQAKAARALKADSRIALTGTPVENHVGDLWSIMEFLNPGWLGTRAEFKRTFHVPIQVNQDPEASAKLRKLTGPFVLRRLKTDKAVIADLPDKNEMTVYCGLTREQASLYQAVVEAAKEDLESADGIRRSGVVLATLTKLKQVCNHPAQFLGDNSAVPGRSGKVARLTEMLEEALSEGDRALIFTQFAEMGFILRKHLQETFGEDAPFLHGGVPKAKRDTMVEQFQRADGPRLFVLSLKAGGTGLNLTRANRVFHFDRWWNPAVEDQATDRAFRIGQKRNVQVHKFVCAGTMEEAVDGIITRKQEVSGRVVGTGEEWLTKLSTEELQHVFALRQDALAD